LDVARQILFSPADLHDLLSADSRTSIFLRKILPFGIRTTANTYGIEGFHLKDVAGVIALAASSALTNRPVHADVETRGEVTRGMLVVDARPGIPAAPNAAMTVNVNLTLARDYITKMLEHAS
jgi:inosine-uridine nucleoside N-ribohydrolase